MAIDHASSSKMEERTQLEEQINGLCQKVLSKKSECEALQTMIKELTEALQDAEKDLLSQALELEQLELKLNELPQKPTKKGIKGKKKLINKGSIESNGQLKKVAKKTTKKSEECEENNDDSCPTNRTKTQRKNGNKNIEKKKESNDTENPETDSRTATTVSTSDSHIEVAKTGPLSEMLQRDQQELKKSKQSENSKQSKHTHSSKRGNPASFQRIAKPIKNGLKTTGGSMIKGARATGTFARSGIQTTSGTVAKGARATGSFAKAGVESGMKYAKMGLKFQMVPKVSLFRKGNPTAPGSEMDPSAVPVENLDSIFNTDDSVVDFSEHMIEDQENSMLFQNDKEYSLDADPSILSTISKNSEEDFADAGESLLQRIEEAKIASLSMKNKTDELTTKSTSEAWGGKDWEETWK